MISNSAVEYLKTIEGFSFMPDLFVIWKGWKNNDKLKKIT